MERPKRNSQKLPDPDFICTLADMYSYKRMLSPTKTTTKKIRRESDESEKTAVRKTADTTQIETPKIPTNKSSKIDTKRRSKSKSPIKASTKFTQKTSPPKSSKALNEDLKRTKQNLISKTKEKSVTKIKVAKKANNIKFTALKIKLKSPKESGIPGRSAKKHDVPRPKADSSLKQKKTNETVTPKQKSKKVKSPQKEITTVDPGEKQPCGRTKCPAKAPICFARVSKRCVGNGYTTRWYHLSYGEHFCSMCFEWAYRGQGKRIYANWRKVWESNGHTDGSMRLFFADQFLPYWVRCAKPECGKWRQLSRNVDVTAELVANYICGSTNKKMVKDPCRNPEDLRAKAVYDSKWSGGLSHAPYLKTSPAAPFLKRYCSDEVGLSPFYNQRIQLQKDRQGQLENGILFDSDVSSVSSESDAEGLDRCQDEDTSKSQLTNGIASASNQQLPIKVSGCLPFLQPFYQPGTPAKALDFNPDFMDVEEMKFFPNYAKCQHNYLALRNTAVALWNLNCMEWLTAEKCGNHLLQRGLVRIKSVMEAERVVNYLTIKGYINYGLVHRPQSSVLTPPNKEHVIVIGAGAAGLSAAHHLNRLGIRVTILEARDRIGGRIHDDFFGDICVGKGAQIVVGSVNNPLMVMAHQASLPMRVINDQCDLYEETGKITDGNTDRRIDYHFNAMLDNVAEWRQRAPSRKDVHLLAKICETHKTFVEESKLPFTELMLSLGMDGPNFNKSIHAKMNQLKKQKRLPRQEERLLQFHISNLEYACGSDLTNVSAKNWDQNETYPQFVGKHMMVAGGYGELFTKMAEGLDVRLNSEVTQILYDDIQATVMLSSGETLTGTRAIVTLPLALLKNRAVFFEPPLPQKKIKAIEGLGAGIIEKIALRFPTRFWADRTKDADCIGHVPSSEETRGLFAVFYDMSPKKDSGPGILKSFVSGNGVRVIKPRSDEDIVQMCVTMLGRMFPEKPIPPVESYFVSHWLEDKYAQMAYSYVPVGSSGALYEALADPVKNKLFFAGEATSRCYPQSVTGAYMSGIREATRILVHINETDKSGTFHSKEEADKNVKRRSKSRSPKHVDVRKRSKDDTADEARVKTKAKVTATKKKSSPNRDSPSKSSSPKNEPLIPERRLTRRMTASIQKPNNNEKTTTEIQSNSTEPVGNKGSQADTEAVEHVDKQIAADDEPSSKKRKMESENVNELPLKRKSESDMTDELYSSVVIKKELLDEQFPNYLDTPIKKEIEDSEGDGLNGSFRVVGSLQFDVSQNLMPCHNDDGQLLNESRSDENIPVDNRDAKDELYCDVDYSESGSHVELLSEKEKGSETKPPRELPTKFTNDPPIESKIDSQMETVTETNTDTQNCVLGDRLQNDKSHLNGKSSTGEFHSNCDCDNETNGHTGVSTNTSNKENSHQLITSDIKALKMKNKDNIELVDSRNSDNNHNFNESKES